MGDWNDGVMVYNIYFLLLCIPQSTIYTPQSDRGDLMLWIMNNPESGRKWLIANS